ncbi:hypothetical protein PV328_010198 [Microctonus aethiopoides]|uniref:Uncharacterized protein n=1 Tax=Microctonus aethiopoides TaxID=144406 RepID=A0AA39C7E8_9HYME|nr:hypothetical protein PV328_010198 [Microctonus aethiopoides]
MIKLDLVRERIDLHFFLRLFRCRHRCFWHENFYGSSTTDLGKWRVKKDKRDESEGLSCYKCGQYNDGVGSITPCINSTAQMHLQECPPSAAWCIKYVSEGSTVRDCVPNCVEKGKLAWHALHNMASHIYRD